LDAEVPKRHLDTPPVARGNVAGRGCARCRVEVCSPNALETAYEHGVWIYPDASLQRAERVVVTRDRPVIPSALVMHARPTGPKRELEGRPMNGVVLSRSVQIDGAGGDTRAVHVEVDESLGDRNRGERSATRPGGCGLLGQRQAYKVATPYDGAQPRFVEIYFVDDELST
jgi:hypothetical protein